MKWNEIYKKYQGNGNNVDTNVNSTRAEVVNFLFLNYKYIKSCLKFIHIVFKKTRILFLNFRKQKRFIPRQESRFVRCKHSQFWAE